MKKLVSIIILCLGCIGILGAQNVWKPINVSAGLLGAAPDGSLYFNCGYSGIGRSQDEGETLQIVLGYETGNDYYFNEYCFTVSPEGRIFVFEDNPFRVWYSDDDGDTWQHTSDIPLSAGDKAWNLYALNNGTLLGSTEYGSVFWTTDGGTSWGVNDTSFEDNSISDVLANENGDVYIGLYYYGNGLYHSTLSDMQNWELVAFEGLGIRDMEFDPNGNVICACYGDGFPGFEQIPDFYALEAKYISISDDGIVYTINYHDDDDTEGLVYSLDHGEHFTEIGERMYGVRPLPNCCIPMKYLIKGFDNHLYYIGLDQNYKSIHNADRIIENFPLENTAWVQFYRSMYEDSTYYQLGIKGDTVVNETTYKKVINCAHLGYPIEGECFGGIREDADGKCYFMSFVHGMDLPWPLYSDCEMNTEYPLYDFSLSVCDVFPTIGLTPHVVFDTTSMQLNGSTRKVLWFGNNCDSGNPYEWQWIEGIGSTHSLLYPIQWEPDNGPEYRLVEVWQDEEMIYRNPHFEEDFPLDNTIWVQFHRNLMLDWHPYYLGITGDTVVDGLTYHKLYDCQSAGFPIQGECFGGIRVEGDKWYFRSFLPNGFGIPFSPIYVIAEDHPEMEFPLYDFSLSVCDQYHFSGDEYGTEYLESVFQIDEMIVNGSTRKRFWFDDNCEEGEHYYGHDWIEGIGSNYGLLYPLQLQPLDGSEYHLDEVWRDGELIYRNPHNNGFLIGNEWYYEILNENGSITYQYMYQAGDTIVNDEPTQILVKINTLYDKGPHEEITREYVYERDGKVYWWNKTLEEFTVLYDFSAQVDDSWVIKVGTETLIMHVDAVDYVEYEGRTYRVMHVSDPDDLFSGDIVCGIGHLTSFFPERLMNNGDGVRVEGLRCYWIENELVFKIGNEDCDAIYDELHGIEDGPSTGSGALLVYPNPTDGILFVETRHGTSLPDQTYRITNLMGQTLLTGQITAETQQIDVSTLPEGMYFITFAGETRKFMVQ